MSTQQSPAPLKPKRASILSGNLRTIAIIVGLIFFAMCAFFGLRGIDNDQVNKIMGVIFTILGVACAFLSIPWLNRSVDDQASSSYPNPSLQINIQTQQQSAPGNATLASPSQIPSAVTGASTLSNKSVSHPSSMGKRNVLDATFFDEMVRTLEGIPATASFQGRSALLTGLPRNIVNGLHRDSNSDANDLELILTQLDGLGPLVTGEQPLMIFLQNASRRMEGLASSASLHQILEKLKYRYGLS